MSAWWPALIPAAAIAGCNLALGIGGYTFEPTGSGGASTSTTSTTATTTATSTSTGQGGQDGGHGGQGGAGGQGGQGSTSAMPVWSKSFGDGQEQMVTSLAADAAGNVYMTGWFYGTLDIAGSMVASQGPTVGFVASFDPMGNGRFADFYAASGDTAATAVAVHGDGSFTVAGTFHDNLTLPTSGGTYASNNRDAFLINYDKTMKPRWSAQVSGGGDETITALVDRADGTVIVAGTYTQDLQAKVKPAAISLPQTPAYASGFVFQVVGATGAASDLRGVGSASPSSGNIAVLAGAAATGVIALAGFFDQTADFGNGTPYSATNKDAFLLQYTDLTHPPGVQTASGNGDQLATGLAVLPAGTVVLGGTFQDNLTFANAPSTTVQGFGTDVFVVGLPPAGAPPALLTVGATDGSGELLGGVAGNAKGVAVAGLIAHDASLTLGGGTPVPLTTSGGQGLFVAKLNPKLDQVLWAQAYDVSTQSYPPAAPVAIGPAGAVYVAGNFNGTIHFGNGTSDLSTMGQDDIYLVKFAP
jgi:hypothetical protein